MEKEDQKLLEVAICGYLPYGLKSDMLDYKRDYVGRQVDLIIGIHEWSKKGDVCVLTDGGSKPSLKQIKPLLHPIECLTKPITVEGYNDGKEFVPIDFFEVTDDDNSCFLEQDHGNIKIIKLMESIAKHSCHFDCQFLPNWVIELFNQWHIDWRGLIPKGLAVAITA